IPDQETAGTMIGSVNELLIRAGRPPRRSQAGAQLPVMVQVVNAAQRTGKILKRKFRRTQRTVLEKISLQMFVIVPRAGFQLQFVFSPAFYPENTAALAFEIRY